MKYRKVGNEIIVSFNYDPKLVRRIKEFEGRRYNPETKEWTIPARHEQEFKRKFDSQLHSFEVGESIELPPITVNQSFGKIPSDYKFKVQPMEHQIKAIEYGLANKKWVLGDEMGCGKTYESLMVADILSKTDGLKHCLIVCGINNLKLNWKNEISKYTNKGAKVLGQKINKNGRLAAGTNKDKVKDIMSIPTSDDFFFITNIESLRNKEVAGALKEMCDLDEIGMVIVDEVHKCTNATSQQTLGLFKLNPKYKIAMTGTPLLNDPVDLYAILYWLNVVTSNIHAFKQMYCIFKLCRTKSGKRFNKLIGYKHLDDLQLKLAKVMFRRRKEEVLTLPDKIFIDEYIEMEKDQADLYQYYADITEELIKKEKTMANALAQLTKLRSITSCSSIVDASCSTAKLDRMEELVAEAIANGTSIVIFSNWVSVVKEVEKRLKKYGVVSITGEKTLEERHNAEMSFQSGKAKIIVGTIKAIGTGCNLTKGTVEIFVDEPWTMADKEQAVDRCHRIGQKSNVVVYSLFTKDTVDEKVHQLLITKKDLSLALVDNSSIIKLIR